MAARSGSASSSIASMASEASPTACRNSPEWLAASAARTSSSNRSTPATAAASGTRGHSSRAWVRWRKASLGANTVVAWPAALTNAASPPRRSWLARQCQASSAAEASSSGPASASRRA